MTCDKCNETIQVGDWPFCPHGKSHYQIIPDDIPGGVLVRHGICHEDGTPKRYYSYSEMRKAAFEKGLIQGDDTPRPNHRLLEAEHARREAKQNKDR